MPSAATLLSNSWSGRWPEGMSLRLLRTNWTEVGLRHQEPSRPLTKSRHPRSAGVLRLVAINRIASGRHTAAACTTLGTESETYRPLEEGWAPCRQGKT